MPFRIEEVKGFPSCYTPQWRKNWFESWIDIGPTVFSKEEAKRYLENYKSSNPNMT